MKHRWANYAHPYQLLRDFVMYLIVRHKGVNCDRSCRFHKIPFVRISNLTGDLARNDRIHIGNDTLISSDYENNSLRASTRTKLTVSHGGRIEIGAKTQVHCTVIVARCLVKIGDFCLIAPNTLIDDNDGHGIRNIFDTSDAVVKRAPIIIEDNVWIGQQSIILKGVRIGKGAIIGAGSIVTHDIPAGVIAAGVPAKAIRRITERDDPGLAVPG